MSTDTQLTYDERYEQGIQRYEANEPIEALIPYFLQMRSVLF